MTDTTDDAILNGRLRLMQPRRGHRFGHDAILLAAAVPAQPGEQVLELGAGVGAASLALLSRVPDTHATLIEIDPHLCELASENILRNGFAARARALVLDAEAAAETFRQAGVVPGSFDHVLMNPPFNDASHQPSPDAMRRLAHEGPAGLLASWLATARELLTGSGQVTLIWRAEEVDAVLDAMHDGFGGIAVIPVYPAPERLAIRVIVTAIRGSEARQRTLPGLTLNGSDMRPSAEAEAILRGGGEWPPATD
ncbi:MAG: methyltransferase [Pseudorhodoplanes sp.]